MSGPEGSSIKDHRLCVMVLLFRSMFMDEVYMRMAIDEAKTAAVEDEVPIGAVIVYNDEVIGRAHNEKEKRKLATAHAEILAIEQASKYVNNWHLDDCTLYVTLEPCMMCSGAIVQSRFKRVVIGAVDSRWPGLISFLQKHTFNHHPIVDTGILGDECKDILSEYFKKKRK